MTERLATLTDEQFAELWNQAKDLNEAAEKMRGAVGQVPRWAVLARASALRRDGMALKRHELRGGGALS